MSSRNNTCVRSSGEVIKQGYLKKLKARTMRKKYFVLRGDSKEASARLEYYDTEKKYRGNYAPKRCITLKTCFNINKRTDIKQKHVIALYTKNDCFCIVLETEEELEGWLKSLLELQLGETIPDGEPVRPYFEHVWQISVCNKELGQRHNIVGDHRLCLTDTALSLVKLGHEDAEMNTIEFSLQKIRRCGHVDTFFYIEVGQCTATGAGNLWMKAEDTNIAQNMHSTILSACENLKELPKRDLLPISRNRSSSANETSKPVSLMQRWPTHTASSGSSGGGCSGQLGVNHQRTYSFPLSPIPPTRRASTGTRPNKFITTSSAITSLTQGVRDRSDSMPSRARTTSENATHFTNPLRHLIPSQFRPHSMYNKSVSYSPPVASSPVSPASGACSTDSAGSSLSMDGDVLDSHWDDGNRQYQDEPVIMEENPDEYGPWPEDEKLNNYVHPDANYVNTSFNSTIGLKHTSNPSSSGFKSSSPSQGSYIDMYSPCGSSPMETGNYLPMSPAENRSTYNRNAINHSRGSSLADDGYVPMAPPNLDDGYVDMDHGPNRSKKSQGQYQSGELSTGSSCSITSGTPSTDIRFSDYPLDKVTTFFPVDEEIALNDRPARAYSVGSRPNNKNRPDLNTLYSYERTRAFSVGSKNGRNPMRINLISQQPLSSSHSSMEPSEDMMELDFSKKGRSRQRKKNQSSERLSVPGGSGSTLSSAASSYSTAEGSYMEMSPRASPLLAPSPPKPCRMTSLLGKSPPKHSFQDILSFNKSSPPVSGYPSPSLGRVLETEPGYMEMTPSISYETKSTPNDAYVEMKLGSGAKPVIAANTIRVESFPSNTNENHTFIKPTSSPSMRSIGNKEDYLDMSLKRKIPLFEDNNNSKIIYSGSPKDDYVDMDLGSGKKSDSSIENEPNYMNMDGKDMEQRKSDIRNSSQPIAIQANRLKDTTLFAFAMRKRSSGTPPKVPCYLPLGVSSPISSPHSSLKRSRQKKSITRRNSQGFVTPTGSNTAIFPFGASSASSPESYESSSKCPVDATSGTVKLSSKDIKINEMLTTVTQVDDDDDYVCYDPSGQTISDDDYTMMYPSTPRARKSSAPTLGSKLKPYEKLLSGLGTSFSSLTVRPTSPVEEPSTSTGVDLEQSTEQKKIVSDPKKPGELHYASLDLMRSGSESEDSNRTLKSQTSLTESSSASTPSPNLTTDSSPFNYAEIDFAKSGSSQKSIH